MKIGFFEGTLFWWTRLDILLYSCIYDVVVTFVITLLNIKICIGLSISIHCVMTHAHTHTHTHTHTHARAHTRVQASNIDNILVAATTKHLKVITSKYLAHEQRVCVCI